MFRRIFAFLLLAWILGFAWFAGVMPNRAAADVTTDGVVSLTGAGGRIEQGVQVVADKKARVLLISGVDSEVTPDELAAEYDIPMQLMNCCITLGYDSVDTRTNATETAAWASENDVKSLRLVTSDWHMRRAAFDLEQQLGPDMRIVRDAVKSEPKLHMLFLEYHKYLARRLAVWLDL